VAAASCKSAAHGRLPTRPARDRVRGAVARSEATTAGFGLRRNSSTSDGTGALGIALGYEVAVIVIPPRAFCLSVTRTLSGGSSTASATSFRILTASASQK